jgi:tetratricopeptide (TPR) repeat protein
MPLHLFRASAACFALTFCVSALVAAPSAAMARAIILAPQSGNETEDATIRQWQARAGVVDAGPEVYERLGWAYVAKARRTLDTGYYKLAEATADVRDAKFGADAESRLLRGHVFHNLHRFADAEKIARELVAERGLASDYALLCDAVMEQGKLTEAVDACQKLVNLRPGVESYSRIAHLRWLKGDLVGATAMMESAELAASARDPESRAWLLTRLSGYYLQGAQISRALMTAESALKAESAYPPALLARGRALLALGKNADAVAVLRRAVELNPLPEYQWWLADALRTSGDAPAAAAVEIALKTRGEASDPRTLALFLSTQRESLPEAVKLSRQELVNRADVLTHDSLAWALAESGDTAAAQKESALALAEHTQDARLLWHAGEIALLGGDRTAADRAFAAARPMAATLTPGERARLERHFSDALVQSR